MTSLDLWLFQTINGLAERSTLLDNAMLMLARPSTLWVPGGLVIAYLLWRDWRQAMVFVTSLASVVVIGDFFGAQIKHLVARARPCRVVIGVHDLVGCGGPFSFPSNHAVNTAAAAAFAHLLFPASGWVTWPIVAIVGVARVYVGAHYVTDVLGGWLIGGSLGVAAGWLLRRRVRPPEKRSVDLVRF